MEVMFSRNRIKENPALSYFRRLFRKALSGRVGVMKLIRVRNWEKSKQEVARLKVATVHIKQFEIFGLTHHQKRGNECLQPSVKHNGD